jgi:hypothetical protein
MSPWLTLDSDDESTLFYWTLSNSVRKQKDWASAVSTLKPESALQASKPTSSNRPSKSSLTNDLGTSSRRSAPSVLSDNVKIISRQPDVAKVRVKTEPLSNPYQDGGLSDNDEIMGEERDFAIKSPPKGKKRVTSEVFFIYCSFNTMT